MMRIETHLHTAEGSACARCTGAEMAHACKERGYDALFVTDHFYHGNTAIDRTLPWEEWVRQFCLGYYHAKEAGTQIGLHVMFGWEYSWDGCDFLTYGLSPEWLAAHPETVTLAPMDYLRLVREAGALIVHAHPFRQAVYVPFLKLLPDMVDAVEVFNAGNADERFNERARWYAESFGLPMTSGSDAHDTWGILGGVVTDCDIRSAADYRAALCGGGIRELITRI